MNHNNVIVISQSGHSYIITLL